jgi:hypothetical protein
MKKNSYATLFFCGLTQAVLGQTLSNIRAEAKGNVVYVYYDLQGSMEGQVFQVDLFSSQNGNTVPLKYVRGDVGKAIVPGNNKKIEWGAKKELQKHAGDITFEIRAQLTYAPLLVKDSGIKKVYKRGSTCKVVWQGSIAEDSLQVDLYRGNKKVADITTTFNKGEYEWRIPATVELGENYQLRLSSIQTPSNTAQSQPFAIKRKIPTVAKIVPVALLAGTAAVLLISGNGGSGSKEGGTSGDDQLPSYPDHTK